MPGELATRAKLQMLEGKDLLGEAILPNPRRSRRDEGALPVDVRLHERGAPGQEARAHHRARAGMDREADGGGPADVANAMPGSQERLLCPPTPAAIKDPRSDLRAVFRAYRGRPGTAWSCAVRPLLRLPYASSAVSTGLHSAPGGAGPSEAKRSSTFFVSLETLLS